jgi:hypothetical protein
VRVKPILSGFFLIVFFFFVKTTQQIYFYYFFIILLFYFGSQCRVVSLRPHIKFHCLNYSIFLSLLSITTFCREYSELCAMLEQGGEGDSNDHNSQQHSASISKESQGSHEYDPNFHTHLLGMWLLSLREHKLTYAWMRWRLGVEVCLQPTPCWLLQSLSRRGL